MRIKVSIPSHYMARIAQTLCISLLFHPGYPSVCLFYVQLLSVRYVSTPPNLAHQKQPIPSVPFVLTSRRKRNRKNDPDYNFDLTTSSLYFTSFNALVTGFHSSNCFRSSEVSDDNSVFTKSSSSKPRMIHGRWYGFGFVRPSYFWISQGTLPTSVVSSAWATARLKSCVRIDGRMGKLGSTYS